MWDELKSLIPKTVRGWILFLIVMIWVPQVLYDLVVKPGLGATGEFIVKLVSSASANLRDSIYATAALDPTALPSQSIYQLIYMALPGMLLGVWIGSQLTRRQQKKRMKHSDASVSEVSIESLEAKLADLNKTQRSFEIAGLVVVLMLATLGTYQVSAQKLSTQIWLRFNADMRILAPKVSDVQVKELQAQFSSMTTKADYVALQERLRILQSSASVKLKSLEE